MELPLLESELGSVELPLESVELPPDVSDGGGSPEVEVSDGGSPDVSDGGGSVGGSPEVEESDMASVGRVNECFVPNKLIGCARR